jgi:hypothetical protein
LKSNLFSEKGTKLLWRATSFGKQVLECLKRKYRGKFFAQIKLSLYYWKALQP